MLRRSLRAAAGGPLHDQNRLSGLGLWKRLCPSVLPPPAAPQLNNHTYILRSLCSLSNCEEKKVLRLPLCYGNGHAVLLLFGRFLHLLYALNCI